MAHVWIVERLSGGKWEPKQLDQQFWSYAEARRWLRGTVFPRDYRVARYERVEPRAGKAGGKGRRGR